jgi:hypothetical protein
MLLASILPIIPESEAALFLEFSRAVVSSVRRLARQILNWPERQVRVTEGLMVIVHAVVEPETGEARLLARGRPA